MVAAFLDANVLYQPVTRSALMYLAATNVFRALWSVRVQDEWTAAVLRKQPGLSPASLARTRALMEAHVDGAVVTGYEPLMVGLTLPDPNDRHVLAAAVHGGADVIVTRNLRHFPKRALVPHNIAAQHPDVFLCQLIDADADGVVRALAIDRASLRKPPMTISEYLAALERNDLVKAAAALREMGDQL